MLTLQKLRRKTLRTLFRYDPSYTDMFEDKSEAYFARLYLYHMEPYLAELPQGAKILDAGCQAGRFTVPLAKMGFQVTGLDSSGFSISRAQKHCRANNVPAEFIRGDIGEICARLSEISFDAILCMEVLYLHRHYRNLMTAMLRVLKQEGILLSSHRTKFYYLIRALQQKDFTTARLIVENEEGILWGTYFNWQTVEQLKMLHNQLGLKTEGIHPVGIFSEFSLSPGELELSGQEALFETEKDPFDEVTGCTRYLLAVAQKVSTPYPHLS